MTELGRMAGISGGQVSRLEFGDRPNASAVTVQKLADALGVSIDWLWNGREERTAEIKVGDFFAAVESRGIRKAIEAAPKRWSLATIAKAVTLDLKSGPDGVPEGGWARVLDDIEDGKYDVSYGDAAAVERATEAQIKKQRRLRRLR